MNGEKTEKMMYVSGVNCKPNTQSLKCKIQKEDLIKKME